MKRFQKAENRISDFGLWIANWGLGIGHRIRFKATAARSIFTSPRSNCRAFTLIELLGVMAIIGILSAVILPSMISKIEEANTTKEDANLEEIARALVAGIKATGTIPDPTIANFTAGSWTAIALNYTTLGQTALASVLPADNDRQIVLSANLASYVAANGYATPAIGWPDPLLDDLKIYILASSKNGLPLLGTIPVADIADWTKVFNATTGTVTVPASVFGAGNTTKGEFLHVKVIDLRSLFCKVDLTDTAAPENIAGFTVTTAGTGYPPSSTVNVSFGNNSLAFGTTPGDTYVDEPHIPPNGVLNSYDFGEAFVDLNANGVYDTVTPDTFQDGIANGIYDTADTLNDNNGDLIYSLSGGILITTVPTLSNCADYNTRRLRSLVVAIPPGTASFTAPVSPNAPTYDLISAAAGSGAFATQTISIYVIKGRSINLFNGAGALDKSVVIQSDVQYRYFNNSWTRVD